jgi:hypothetical protein
MNHRRLKPDSAPSLGVTINSPEPTIIELRINPGPIWRSKPASDVGAGRVSGGFDGILYMMRRRANRRG